MSNTYITEVSHPASGLRVEIDQNRDWARLVENGTVVEYNTADSIRKQFNYLMDSFLRTAGLPEFQ